MSTEQPARIIPPVVNSLTEDSFGGEGRRTFLSYRDLGIAAAMDGEYGARVGRANGPGEQALTGWHYHECELHLNYVLKGWTILQFEGRPPQRVEAGSCVMIPPGTLHNELGNSDDLEYLEITRPAQIKTIPVETPADAASWEAS